MLGAIGACPLRGQVDPRLVRFSAGATAVVLGVALLVADAARPLAIGLLASQVAVFGFTAFVSYQWSVWAQLYARFIWPRVGPPAALTDARPPRFSQLLGFLITALALALLLVGDDGVAYALTSLAVVTATLNAATGLCLGCRVHQLVRPTA